MHVYLPGSQNKATFLLLIFRIQRYAVSEGKMRGTEMRSARWWRRPAYLGRYVGGFHVKAHACRIETKKVTERAVWVTAPRPICIIPRLVSGESSTNVDLDRLDSLELCKGIKEDGG